LPVPLVGVDPESGTTLGLLPVKLVTDDNHEIRRIIAPDFFYNPFFGYGMHARVYDYPSEDEQWSVVGGIKERVEREFDAEYQQGRLRETRWSINGSLIYDRSGTPRFFGIGNESPTIAETDYTEAEELAQIQVGLNLNHAWQLLYTGRFQVVDVLPGTLAGIASLQSRFAHILGEGTNDQLLNRLSIGYDTRDNLTVPTRGMEWVVYTGLASRRGLLNDSMYSEFGIDGRVFWPLNPDTVVAWHMALRYLPTAHRVPFWALSSIGGDQSQIGGDQPLRGYGTGRYYDRDSFSTTVELRRRVWSFNAVSTKVDLEVDPFVDLGRVFGSTSTFPITKLHPVGGVGFRGIAKPFVVGYVDIGYGDEGVAVFTGINYPF
jgi:outer membrane protein assembly factor BamA